MTSPPPPRTLGSSARMLLVVLVATALGACASSSATGASSPSAPDRAVVRGAGFGILELFTEPGVGERTVEALVTDVWALLPSVYESLDIPITRSDPVIRELGNSGYRASRIEGVRMSRFFRCGRSMTGLLADEHSITLTVVTRATALPDGKTNILTTADAMARPRATGGQPFRCESSGILEMRVAQLVLDRLSG